MYYGTIKDEQVKYFHRDVELTASYTELNSLASGALFDKTKMNKLIPKFYFDKIIGNDNVTILEDLLVIYMSNEDLNSLYFTGKKENVTFDIIREYVNSSPKVLELHFYDNQSLFNLAGFHFHIHQNVTNGVDIDVVSDDYGNVLVKFTGSDTFIITCQENGQTISW